MLLAKYACFVSSLQRVFGRVELSLRVLEKNDDGQQLIVKRADSFDSQLTPVSGYDYMLTRLKVEQRLLSRRRQAEVMTSDLLNALAHLSVESTHQVLPTPNMLLKAAYLVAEVEVQAFCMEVKKFVPNFPDLRFLLTGPWPPYNFVSI
jgi:hypothetical protein